MTPSSGQNESGTAPGGPDGGTQERHRQRSLIKTNVYPVSGL